MKRLVAASGNPGKLREFEQVLAPLGFEIVSQASLGIGEPEEPHGTFVENALVKARNACRASGLSALADDSGICAAALGAAPGVHSARYAVAADGGVLGREEQDRLNNAKLIAALAQQGDRAAHYYCVIVLLRHVADPEPIVAEGRWHGEVIDTPRGTNGFGYDPYFLLPDLGRTAAELTPDDKNAISHRGQALRALLSRLQAV